MTQLDTYRKHLNMGSVSQGGSELEKGGELVTGI